MNLQETAAEIYKLLKPYNIKEARNCMTRLRLHLEDLENAPLEKLKKVDNVLGVNLNGTELQIILGPGRVNEVAAEFKRLLEEKQPHGVKQQKVKMQIGQAEKVHQQIRSKNATPFKLLLKKISNIFMPLIPAFIACGLVTGLLNIALKIDPSLVNYPAVQILQIAGNAVFWGLNIFVGVNTAKECGASPMLGGTMAVIITHPLLNNISLFNVDLLAGRGGIIAVLMVVAFSSWLEIKLHKIIPKILDLFLTPLLVILIATFPALFILQPLGGIIAENIGFAVTQAIGTGGAAAGFVIGGVFLPLVMTGLHQGLTPIHAELLNQYGVTILLPILAMAGAGQVGASIAVYLKTKNKKLKQTIASALPVGFMGIGEPLIYGVTLPLGKPFIAACIGGAFGGAVQAFFIVGATSIGLSGLPLAASTDKIIYYLLGLITAYTVGFIAAWFIGFSDPAEE
ncbi:MAG TPA: PTS transporter subunit EIIC [Candidatus Megamonas gallistercoris]|nr:PTS transporter subunit EIIC [Candidatus Megamonas gallistercoris]